MKDGSERNQTDLEQIGGRREDLRNWGFMVLLGQRKEMEQPILVCEHCKKQWHTKDQCWQLHDRPPRANKRSSNKHSGRTNVREIANTSQSTGPTTSQTGPPTLDAIARSGMPQSLGIISGDGKNPWILDPGATCHLIGSSEHSVSHTPCDDNEKIKIADGSLTPDCWQRTNSSP